MYINNKSNHPRSILKQLPVPESIEQRISSISSDQIIFENVAPLYDEALKTSGYNQPMKYHPRNKEIHTANEQE